MNVKKNFQSTESFLDYGYRLEYPDIKHYPPYGVREKGLAVNILNGLLSLFS